MNSLGRVVQVLGVVALVGTTACKEEGPKPVVVHRDQGDKHLSNNEWKEAAAEYTLSLEADPKQEKLWEKKAYAHKQAGEYDEADAAILKMAELQEGPLTQEKKIEMYLKLANTYLQSGVADRAEKYFMMIIEIDPQNDVALGWVAEINAQRGGARTKNPAVLELLDKAFEYYDKVIAVRPESPNAYFNKRIAMIKYQEGLLAQIDVAKQAIEVNKKDKAKVKELEEKIAQLQMRIEDLRKQYDEISAKGTEVMKAWKAAQAATQVQDAGTAAPAAP